MPTTAKPSATVEPAAAAVESTFTVESFCTTVEAAVTGHHCAGVECSAFCSRAGVDAVGVVSAGYIVLTSSPGVNIGRIKVMHIVAVG